MIPSMDSEDAKEKSARTGWMGVRCDGIDDMRTQNIRFWQEQGGAAIRQAAWELVEEMWSAQGRNPDELRFQRLAPEFRRP
jgi:hypothetical protein